MAGKRSNIDADGYRANVAIAICNSSGQLFWGKRFGSDAWQFPQGGIKPHESIENAMYRELHEETGLLPEHVEVLGSTQGWLRYRLPKRYIRRNASPLCIGQKQRWYLLKLVGHESNFNLASCRRPEFDGWRWVDFWHPVDEVVSFKRIVYKRALTELEGLLKG
ncbi:MAG: RNA pyrophosphohydrolase [Gammaproteobacteria bacterium]